jgi:glycosyltransferase involved in cell wall biosynthesis
VSSAERRSILVLSPGAVEGRLSGPEIRALEFARALAVDSRVTIASPLSAARTLDGMRVVGGQRQRLIREAARHDVVMSACMPPYLLMLKRLLGFVAIADLYDPMEHELATIVDPSARSRELQKRAAILALQMRSADAILCAGSSQRAQLRSSAFSAGESIPDPVVVPFGIPDPPPPAIRRPLREHFAQLADGDRVILWWGSVWRWLDVETVIRAMAKIAADRDDIKLVITAGRPPNSLAVPLEATHAARQLATQLGVVDRQVLFLDEWVAYDERHEYLAEADLGITLHRDGSEAELAARARYMDYLWAGLPCVLGRGDEIAQEFADAGFATLVDEHDPRQLAQILTRLLDAPAALAAARRSGVALGAQRRWASVGAVLRDAVGAVSPRAATPSETTLLWRTSGDYYVRELADRARSRPV